jgi:D-sedoheptulose 7-phosphate isomerase
MNSIREYLLETQKVLGEVADEAISNMVSMLLEAWRQQKNIFILGNGGSASTASHMANDLSKATIVPGKKRMKAIALTDSISLITAWANDTSYEQVFKEQLENLLDRGDIVIGISASGNSPNVLRAIEFARQNGAVTIGWSGLSGGKLRSAADYCIHAPTDDVGMIEGIHLMLDHLISKELRMRIQNGSDLASQ